MKFTTASVAFLATALPFVYALPSPAEAVVATVTAVTTVVVTPSAVANAPKNHAALDSVATVLVDDLQFRRCLGTQRRHCGRPGTYTKGQQLVLKCFTRDGTETVDGDAGWAQTSDGNWIPLANGKNVKWDGVLSKC